MFSQISFDPLDYKGGATEAKRERDAMYRSLKKIGRPVTRFVLRGQLRKYAGLGVEDGRVRDVYFLQIGN